MEIRDGFIVGVYNHCDAWCDRCPFTSHCRVFADTCQVEATLLDEMNEPARAALPDDAGAYRRRELRAVPERDAIDCRAESYCRRVRAWLARQEFDMSADGNDPRAVIAWFHMMIHVKAMRALHGLAEDGPSGQPPDHDGSAKAALIGIDRSETAWLDLVEVGLASTPEVTPFAEDLAWLRAALERTFPKARSFVRTAFDEPEEVARLLQGEI